jgi:ribose 5-phosphate isomerase B
MISSIQGQLEPGGNMKIGVACDHGGFILKETILDIIIQNGHSPIDLGTFEPSSTDYPDYAEKLGNAIQAGEVERGVLICGSGIGASIAANKLHGVYAAICHDTYSAHQGVQHDRMNVLCLGARVVGTDLAKELVAAFLKASFLPEERHIRRTQKIKELEEYGKVISKSEGSNERHS